MIRLSVARLAPPVGINLNRPNAAGVILCEMENIARIFAPPQQGDPLAAAALDLPLCSDERLRTFAGARLRTLMAQARWSYHPAACSHAHEPPRAGFCVFASHRMGCQPKAPALVIMSALP